MRGGKLGLDFTQFDATKGSTGAGLVMKFDVTVCCTLGLS